MDASLSINGSRIEDDSIAGPVFRDQAFLLRDTWTGKCTSMRTHRPPLASVSRVLYIAMAISALVSVAVYVAIAKTLIDLIQSHPIERASDVVWLAAIALSIPISIAAIVLAIVQRHAIARLGALLGAIAIIAWNASFGDRTIALLLLVPLALILIATVWLLLRRPAPGVDILRSAILAERRAEPITPRETDGA